MSAVSTRGVLASLISSTGFATLAWYASILSPRFTGWEIFGWRMVLIFPALTIAMVVTGRGRRMVAFIRDLFSCWWRLPVLVINSALVAVQMVLFTWAPGAGHAVELSLGYFLMPLVMILIGRVGFRETLTRGQALATALAATGVGYEIIRSGGLGWPTLVVAIGYPAYFVSRRMSRMANASALWAEMALAMPLAFVVLGNGESLSKATDPIAILLILGLGIISSGSTAIYTGAQLLLPFALFGLLSYLEPVLLAIVAFVILRETITVAELPTYVLIWLAVMVLAVEAARRLGRRRRRHDMWWPELHGL